MTFKAFELYSDVISIIFDESLCYIYFCITCHCLSDGMFPIRLCVFFVIIYLLSELLVSFT